MQVYLGQLTLDGVVFGCKVRITVELERGSATKGEAIRITQDLIDMIGQADRSKIRWESFELKEERCGYRGDDGVDDYSDWQPWQPLFPSEGES